MKIIGVTKCPTGIAHTDVYKRQAYSYMVDMDIQKIIQSRE